MMLSVPDLWIRPVLTVLAAVDPVPAEEDVKPGWVALVLVLVLCAVTVLLWLSMRKQLGRIRIDKEPQADRPVDGDSRAS